ncbi:CPA1 family monovalent cation:H+ antiporter [Filimonas zeae]|uniref:Na+/H+ antiporter n=1 Tax=Filimonas zeae TaxID=1737353 RepID=A0A917MTP8_9BACT|nr:Na+/H+ antiporter [Filimonas zeae]MDR6339527.1 CPA1 family monovalent cation:H+ antiporter [Filimonas zeae]GGH63206.1 Na+/H+ antiporter [Filimonas zeae]
MQHLYIQYLVLILLILALVMLANKLRLAYPIVLVVGGLALSSVDGLSNITIEPDLVFFIFLPPLLYDAAWQTSWKDFWKWRRVIASFAFLIVILTSCVIAFTTTWLIPGFTLAMGFLLGGIVSPPDAISATTIMRRLNAPRGLVSIIEGESLLNDASSLIVFRFALAAVITGQFHFGQAAGSFFAVIIMGTLIGLAVGLVFYAIHRWLPTTTPIEIVLSLITPYCMYYAAESFHYSGVLAVVSGGLFLSHKRNSMLSFESRLQGINVWSVLGFVLNGIIFLLIGLELPVIVRQLGDVSLGQAIGYGLLISLILIVTRVLCTLGTSLFTTFISRFITVADARPGFRMPLVFGWAGMRGVVSLAAALSIPILMDNGQAFPQRNLILFITFIVILVTLVFQGLTLPALMRLLKITDKYEKIPRAKQELLIQKKLAWTAVQLIDKDYAQERDTTEHLNSLYQKLQTELHALQMHINEPNSNYRIAFEQFRTIYLQMLEAQRQLLHDINQLEEFDEELVRKYHTLVDMEEFKIREKMPLDA